MPHADAPINCELAEASWFLQTRAVNIAPRRNALARMEIIALLFVLAVVVGLTCVFLSFERDTFRTSGSAMDIRLVGVCPDASDDLYDVEGKKIGERFFDGSNISPWASNNLRRDFIFEPPAGSGIQPVSYKIQLEHQEWFVGSGSIWNTELTNHRTFSISTTFADKFWRNSMFFGSQRPVEFVNVTLGFYRPDRGKPVLQFQGPFASGVTNKAQRRSELTFTGDTTSSGTTNARFHLSTAMTDLNQSSLLFHDKKGDVHWPNVNSSSSNGRELVWDGTVPNTTISDIVSVEVYQPEEKTFYHVRVRYHDRRDRIFPEANEKLEAILGTNKFQRAQYGGASLNATQALAVIDVVRGSYMVQEAANAILKARIDFNSLSAVDRDRIHGAAWKWATAEDSSVRFYGINFGLRGHWNEFVPLAFELLPGVESYRLNELITVLAPMAPAFSSTQLVAVLAERSIHGRDEYPDTFIRNAAMCFLTNNPVAASNVVIALCADERPWIWWPALETVGSRVPITNLPPVVQMHWMAIQPRSTNLFSSELVTRAREQMTNWLTPEFCRRCSTGYSSLYRHTIAMNDRETAIRITMRCLRELPSGENFMTTEMLRKLNAVTGKDFGGLGRQATPNVPATTANELQRALAEAITWDNQRAK